LFIPLISLFFQLNTIYGITLSRPAVFGAAIAFASINFRRAPPAGAYSLFAWDAIVIMVCFRRF
jgi:hypothetical protein